MKLHTLRSDALTVQISEHGAEMQSIKTQSGLELLWQGDPACWARRAPNLFPIVGRLKNDTLRHQGQSYPLSQHGFARDLAFITESASDSQCTLLLKDSEQTRKSYPFAFELRLRHELKSSELKITYAVKNPDSKDLFCSVGTHPGFAWPLIPGIDKQQHKILFEKEEPAPIKRLKGGLIQPEPHRSPIQGRELPLSEELFIQEAFFMDQMQSRSLTYMAPGTPRVRIDYPDFPHMGIWSKLGSPFLCIEPWQGYHSPEGFDGELCDKPGIVRILPYQEKTWRYTIAVES